MIPSTHTVAKNTCYSSSRRSNPSSGLKGHQTRTWYMKPLPSKFLIIFFKKRMKKRKLISTQLPIETPILTFYENHQYLAPPQFSFPHPLLATYAPYICGNQAGLFQIRRRPFHFPPLLILYHPTKLLTLAVLMDNNSTSSGPI